MMLINAPCCLTPNNSSVNANTQEVAQSGEKRNSRPDISKMV